MPGQYNIACNASIHSIHLTSPLARWWFPFPNATPPLYIGQTSTLVFIINHVCIIHMLFILKTTFSSFKRNGEMYAAIEWSDHQRHICGYQYLGFGEVVGCSSLREFPYLYILLYCVYVKEKILIESKSALPST